MSIRCPNCIRTYIGNNAASVCDRALAKRSGFNCPKQRNQYDPVSDSCFHIETLIRKDKGRGYVPVDEAREILFPERPELSGDGIPTKKPDKVDEAIKTLGEPLP